MPVDLEADPVQAISLCRTAHARLIAGARSYMPKIHACLQYGHGRLVTGSPLSAPAIACS